MSITLVGDSGFRAAFSSVQMYSDGTPMIKNEKFGEAVFDADTIVLRPNSLNEFVAGMFLVDAINDSGGSIDRLVLPYLPGARQDRINPTGDVLFTALSVARMINERNFSRVISVDPHSPEMPSLIKNFVEYPLERVAARVYKGYGGVIAPDKGAKDRAERFAAVLGTDVTYASKTRDVSTGRLTGFGVDVEPGRHYLVVDDICDGGGTFLGLGEKIKEQGAHADLFVTHGIFSKGTDALKSIYKNIYTTNTREIHDRNDVSRFNVVREMENYND